MSSLSTSVNSPRFTTRKLVLLALMGALMMGSQVAMASLPNIEPVSLLIICCTLIFGIKSLYSTAVFILLEGVIYGFGIWWFSYLYLWPLLVFATLFLMKTRSYLFLTALSSVYGLMFGALCAIPYYITGGWAAGFSYWVSGIPFDLLHCVGNAVMAGLLLKPLHNLLAKLAGVPLWD